MINTKKELLNSLMKYELNENFTFIDLFKETEYIFNKLPKTKTNNILITQFNGLGDAILSTGFISSIFNLFPNYNIYLACGNNVKDIFECSPYKVIIADLDNSSLINLIKSEINIIYSLNIQFDLVISPNWGSKVLPALLFNYFTGCRNTIGFGHYYPLEQYFDKEYFKLTFGNQFNFDDYILKYNIINPIKIINDIDRKQFLLNEICKIFDKDNIRIENKLYLGLDDYKYQVADKYKIVLCLGGSRENKKYKKWKKVINEISKDDAIIYIIGSGKDEYKNAELLVNNKVVNLVNKLSIRESIALISQCNLYIGNDTSMAHAAYIYNLPLIVVSCEGKDRQIFKEKGLLSYYSRFYSNYKNCYFIQPEENIGECKTTFIENGCVSNKAHCINRISPQKIILAYKKIRSLKNDLLKILY